MSKDRYIVHVDMDAFFAAVEQRDNPSLRDKPVVVGADPKNGCGRGVVSTCSYEARKFGIHSAMPITLAYQNCPQAIFLPVDMQKYIRVSGEIYNIFERFTPLIEPVGIDEAFLDITSSFHLFGTPLETCVLIKETIKKETQLIASLGLAPTKMAAKIASDLRKPDGLVEVEKENLLDFLWPLSVDKIWGLGKKSKELLNERGIKTIGQLAKRDAKELSLLFGQNGEYFWQLAHGIDEREVTTGKDLKSISNEITFDIDTSDKNIIEPVLLTLCEKVSGRLRLQGFKGKTITLKIRLKGFYTYTRALTLNRATNFVDEIYKTVKKLYNAFISSASRKDNLYQDRAAELKKVRLVGVKVSNFIPANAENFLFNDKLNEKKENIHKAIEIIKGKFGDSSIQRAASRSCNNKED